MVHGYDVHRYQWWGATPTPFYHTDYNLKGGEKGCDEVDMWKSGQQFFNHLIDNGRYLPIGKSRVCPFSPSLSPHHCHSWNLWLFAGSKVKAKVVFIHPFQNSKFRNGKQCLAGSTRTPKPTQNLWSTTTWFHFRQPTNGGIWRKQPIRSVEIIAFLWVRSKTIFRFTQKIISAVFLSRPRAFFNPKKPSFKGSCRLLLLRKCTRGFVAAGAFAVFHLLRTFWRSAEEPEKNPCQQTIFGRMMIAMRCRHGNNVWQNDERRCSATPWCHFVMSTS